MRNWRELEDLTVLGLKGAEEGPAREEDDMWDYEFLEEHEDSVEEESEYEDAKDGMEESQGDGEGKAKKREKRARPEKLKAKGLAKLALLDSDAPFTEIALLLKDVSSFRCSAGTLTNGSCRRSLAKRSRTSFSRGRRTLSLDTASPAPSSTSSPTSPTSPSSSLRRPRTPRRSPSSRSRSPFVPRTTSRESPTKRSSRRSPTTRTSWMPSFPTCLTSRR